MKQNNSDRKIGWLFISPAVLIILVFTFIALAYVIYMSLFNFDFKFNGEVEKTFIGFQNYIQLFSDDKFHAALRNTLSFSLMVVPMQMIISLFLAYLLTQKVKFTNFFRTIYFLPMITATTAITMIFLVIFSVNGPLNNMLVNHDIITKPIAFLQDAKYALKFIAGMSIWQSVPFTTIILIAAMADVSVEQYEAADLDGASEFLKFRKVTFPAIIGPFVFALVLALVGSLQLFDQTYIISGGSGGPGDSTLSLSLLIYNYAFNATYSSMGYAAALSVVLGVVIYSLTSIVRRIEKRMEG